MKLHWRDIVCLQAAILFAWNCGQGVGFTVSLDKREISKCYGELGCMITGGNFYQFPERPLSFLPIDREQLNTRFLLLTRQNPNFGDEQFLVANDADSIKNSFYDSKKDTKLITHGFIGNPKRTWIEALVAALLDYDDYNIILVDWSAGSGLPYTVATANTRLVGAETALLINYLIEDFHASSSQFHFIAHSLGAHVAGYTGERVNPRIARITGLDPAEPYFKNTHPEVRLDPTDAEFVDVIHTDMAHFVTTFITQLNGFGLEQAIGHVDFYPNGGKDQPGCSKLNVFEVIMGDGFMEGARHFVTCNHYRACWFFVDSVKYPESTWLANQCDSYTKYKYGQCADCGEDGSKCAVMGFHADKYAPHANNPESTLMYLNTGDKSPYGVYKYHVEIILWPGQWPEETGDINIHITGSSGSTTDIKLNEDELPLKPGIILTFLVSNGDDLGDPERVKLSWECQSSMINPMSWCRFRDPKIYVYRIQIKKLLSNRGTQFCGSQTGLGDGIPKVYLPSNSCTNPKAAPI